MMARLSFFRYARKKLLQFFYKVHVKPFSVFCPLLNRLNLKSEFSVRSSWKEMLKRTHRKAVSHISSFCFSFLWIHMYFFYITNLWTLIGVQHSFFHTKHFKYAVRRFDKGTPFQPVYTSCLLVPGLKSPVFKDYQRNFIQERDRDMNADRSYDNDYNLFSCLSRLVIKMKKKKGFWASPVRQEHV